MTDLTAPAARVDRDQLADRVDVLDKVKVLVALPDDLHATTEQVAAFYEVPVKTIQTVTFRNGDELDDDGYRVVTRGAFEVTFNMKVTSSASRIALFPRRAILRVGMLLRDSTIARQVRDHLLDSEKQVADFDPARLSRLDILKMALAAEEEKSILDAALESAAPAIEYHDRHIAEDDDLVLVEVWAAWFGLTRPQAYNLLVEKNIAYKKVIGQRWSAKKGKVVDECEYRARAGRETFSWFELRPQHNAPRHHNNQVRQTLYVKAFFADRLADKCGLTRVTARGDAA